MPRYTVKCTKCGNEEEVVCPVKERNAITCKCGGGMKVKIVKGMGNFRMRHGRPDVIEWKKERGVLDL